MARKIRPRKKREPKEPRPKGYGYTLSDGDDDGPESVGCLLWWLVAELWIAVGCCSLWLVAAVGVLAFLSVWLC